MKRLWLVLFLLFCCGSVFAQTKNTAESGILVELTFDEAPEIKREIEIPIDKRGFGVGGKQFCNNCDDKFEEYEYNAGVWQLKKDKFRVRFAFIYPRKWKGCNFEKIFVVDMKEPSEMQLKCGVRLKAYYAKAKKEE